MDQSPIEPAAEEVALSPAETPSEPLASGTLAPAFAVAAWFLPGLGHLLLGRWAKAAAFFVAVAGLAILGYAVRGAVFPPHSDGPFGTLGFLADAGSGVIYLLSRIFEPAGSDISRAVGDYGTRLIAAAGIVNLIAILDAYEIAGHRRP